MERLDLRDPGRLTTGPFAAIYAACYPAALIIDLGLTAVGPRALWAALTAAITRRNGGAPPR